MHPAFSVIFFTTLSGAGYGLLACGALAALTGSASARTLVLATALGLALVTIGLLSSLGHLGKPARAWRAFSQWRTSWLSREGVAAVLTYVPAVLFGRLAWLADAADPPAPVPLDAPAVAIASALIAGAALTVVCTAMIYASLKPVPAWRHPLVVPGYLLFAGLTGAALLAASTVWNGGDSRVWSLAVAIAAAAVASVKWRYWRAIDRAPLPVTRGDALGLPARDARVFERPHTQHNYLTREMGFVLARTHAHRLRGIALALCGVVAGALAVGAAALPAVAPVVLPLAALAALSGALVERWLFFAQARHLVTLYY